MGTSFPGIYINGVLNDTGSSSGGSSGSSGVGTSGVGIASIRQTTTSTADGGVNLITVTLTDGTTSTFHVRNGSKGEASQPINDSIVSDSNPWSSERIVECFPSFAVSGDEVSFKAVPGSPLKISTVLTFKQDGSGDPSTTNDNVRPITAYKSFQLLYGPVLFGSSPFGRSVCCGGYSWDTGTLTEDVILDEFDGSADENIIRNTDENSTSKYLHGYNFSITLSGVADKDKRSQSCCNRMRFVVNEFKNFDYETYSLSQGGTLLNIMPPAGVTTVDDFRAWLAQNPVQIAYIPLQPRVTHYEAQVIRARTDTNIMRANQGNLYVSGRSLPSIVISELTQRIETLEQFGASNGNMILTDSATGKAYMLYVNNGKLKMSEVTN